MIHQTWEFKTKKEDEKRNLLKRRVFEVRRVLLKWHCWFEFGCCDGFKNWERVMKLCGKKEFSKLWGT
jgi:hypothetical protein